MSVESEHAVYLPFKAIADSIGCDVSVVQASFQNVAPEIFTKEKLDQVLQEIDWTKDAATAAHTLAKTLSNLGQHTRAKVGVALGEDHISFDSRSYEAKRLARTLENVRNELKEHYASIERRGGTEPATGMVLNALAEIFVSEGLPITFGHTHGEPSTAFCRAVETAFKALGISTGWRSVTENFLKKSSGNRGN